MTSLDTPKERVQKILARAGYGSRRACEELIVAGRVTVNDQTVSVLGVRADPQRDVIAVDGERVRLPRPAYWILNKPAGASFNDPEAETVLEEMVKGKPGRLFTAGRLDRQSSGLIVVTNDGRVANILTHPRYRVPKVYRVTVKESLVGKNARNIERALYYAMNNGAFEPLNIVKQSARQSEFLLTVYEGLPPSLRDICLKFGHSLKSMVRERIGIVEMGDLKGGEVKKLHADQVNALLAYVAEAESGRLEYENELVKPSRFQRNVKESGFRQKKTGTRGKGTGQKKTSARVKSAGRKGGRSGKPPAKGGRPRQPASRTGDQRSTGSKRPAGGQRSTAGKRSAGDRRPTAGKRPAGSKRPTGGKRPAGGQQSTAGKRSAGDRRPTAGKRPAGSKRPTGGKRPAGSRGASQHKRSPQKGRTKR